MKKVYIDITQLYNWHGKVTGIQRVMYEISARFRGDARFEHVFVIWNKNAASFYKVDFDTIEAALQKDNRSTTSYTAKQTFNYKAALKRVYHHVPLSRTMYNLGSSARGRITNVVNSSNIVTIDASSTLFMPHGGVWESETYIREIVRLRKTQDVKLIPILFDMCPIISPQFVVKPVRDAFYNYMKQILPESDLIVAISENTAKDARAWLSSNSLANAKNIEVFRLGDEVGGESVTPVDVPDEFILCVGTIEARKNHTALYYTYKLAMQEGHAMPPIVFVGRVGWMAQDFYTLCKEDPDIKQKFVFLHSASDEQLAWLYGRALFTVYPSFYEGWGLPIAESLLRGTPCIASETSSMKEIGGELVEYFSPYSPEQIKNQIVKYYGDRALLADMKQRIQTEYVPTTWDRSYKQVSDAIENL